MIVINNKKYKLRQKESVIVNSPEKQHVEKTSINDQMSHTFGTLYSPSAYVLFKLLNNTVINNPKDSPKDDTWKYKIDLPTEFMLIDSKKSKLSKHKRDWVVAEFNKFYEELI